jgi:hypothetical protein
MALSKASDAKAEQSLIALLFTARCVEGFSWPIRSIMN